MKKMIVEVDMLLHRRCFEDINFITEAGCSQIPIDSNSHCVDDESYFLILEEDATLYILKITVPLKSHSSYIPTLKMKHWSYVSFNGHVHKPQESRVGSGFFMNKMG